MVSTTKIQRFLALRQRLLDLHSDQMEAEVASSKLWGKLTPDEKAELESSGGPDRNDWDLEYYFKSIGK